MTRSISSPRRNTPRWCWRFRPRSGSTGRSLIGCSIGGRIALHLALEHPERFRAIIGLQAGAHVDPYYDLNFLHRPDVHGGEVCGAIVSGLVGPDAPDKERWETLWHYMQGGPGVFKGDLYFYKLDGDIRGRVAQIDTRRCPLFLLSGEYDYSCTPEETLAVANSIPGCEVTIMKGLGHFPMSEDPQAFLTHLLPVLEKIGEEVSGRELARAICRAAAAVRSP